MKLLPCVFVSRDADGVVNGLLAVHVDDVICAAMKMAHLARWWPSCVRA